MICPKLMIHIKSYIQESQRPLSGVRTNTHTPQHIKDKSLRKLNNEACIQSKK